MKGSHFVTDSNGRAIAVQLDLEFAPAFSRSKKKTRGGLLDGVLGETSS